MDPIISGMKSISGVRTGNDVREESEDLILVEGGL